MASDAQVRQLIAAWQHGSDAALIELLPMVYDQLKILAASHLKNERPGHTLQTTALVNEAYAKMLGQHPGRVQDQRQFYAVAAKAMRQILIDHARGKTAQKRPNPKDQLSLDSVISLNIANIDTATGLVALDQALRKLEVISPRAATVVEMLAFAGIDRVHVAELLGVSTKTVARDWKAAKAWLLSQLMATKELD